jgi:hypothetical protein
MQGIKCGGFKTKKKKKKREKKEERILKENRIVEVTT